jgi:hypothetical protein
MPSSATSNPHPDARSPRNASETAQATRYAATHRAGAGVELHAAQALALRAARQAWPLPFGYGPAGSEGCRDIARRAKSGFPLPRRASSPPSVLPGSRMPRSYVYILQSESHPDRFYTGFTQDLEARLRAHPPPPASSGAAGQQRLLRLHPSLPSVADQDGGHVHRSRSGTRIRALPQIALGTRVRQEAALSLGLSYTPRKRWRCGRFGRPGLRHSDTAQQVAKAAAT